MLACILILAERTGKAVRTPAKSALLAHAAKAVGLGRGFAVHKTFDQVGAVAGPLVVAGIAALTGALWHALAVLAVPGALAVLLLLWIRSRMGKSHRILRAAAHLEFALPSLRSAGDGRARCSGKSGSAGVADSAARALLAVRCVSGRHHRGPGAVRGHFLPPGPGERGPRGRCPGGVCRGHGGRSPGRAL